MQSARSSVEMNHEFWNETANTSSFCHRLLRFGHFRNDVLRTTCERAATFSKNIRSFWTKFLTWFDDWKHIRMYLRRINWSHRHALWNPRSQPWWWDQTTHTRLRVYVLTNAISKCVGLDMNSTQVKKIFKVRWSRPTSCSLTIRPTRHGLGAM